MTGARPDTWMPLYWGDYLRDTGHLNAAEHGAYLLLIGHYWTSGQPLPDDEARLARIARMDTKEWKAARATLASFFSIGDSLWRHDRIDRELTKATKITEAKAEAGRKGAAKKWHGHVKPDGKQNGKTMAEPSGSHDGSQWQTDAPSQPPSPSHSSEANASSEETHMPPDGGACDPGPIPEFLKRQTNGHAKPESKPKRRDYSEDFEAFWKAYPQNPADTKASAFKAWNRVAGKSVSEVALLDAADKYAAHCQRTGHDRPAHVQTWINREGWTASYEGSQALRFDHL